MYQTYKEIQYNTENKLLLIIYMSQYFDEKDIFSGPIVEQYGSHMIMKNVKKNAKVVYLNIDTKFRDDYENNQAIDYTITLPERINNVKSLYITDMEVPLSYYVISDHLENNIMKISYDEFHILLTIPDGDYDETSLADALNTALSAEAAPYSNISASITNNKLTLQNSSSTEFTIEFNVDKNNCNDKNSLKSKLGWIMGFTKEYYTLTSSITGESFVDIYGPKYLFLVLDEYPSGNCSNGFISFLPRSRINKNILARLSLERAKIGFNGVHNGDVTCDMREYSEKTDLQRIRVQLIDEFNRSMNLNGRDLSFCLRISYE